MTTRARTRTRTRARTRTHKCLGVLSVSRASTMIKKVGGWDVSVQTVQCHCSVSELPWCLNESSSDLI